MSLEKLLAVLEARGLKPRRLRFGTFEAEFQAEAAPKTPPGPRDDDRSMPTREELAGIVRQIDEAGRVGPAKE